MIVKGGKSSPGSPICSGLHCTADSAPVLVSPSGATAAAVTVDAAVPILNRVAGVTDVRVPTSLQPNPSAQTILPPSVAKPSEGRPHCSKAPGGKPPLTATETPGRFCSRTAARTSSRARSTAAAYGGDGAESLTDGTSGGCAKGGAATVTAR